METKTRLRIQTRKQKHTETDIEADTNMDVRKEGLLVRSHNLN